MKSERYTEIEHTLTTIAALQYADLTSEEMEEARQDAVEEAIEMMDITDEEMMKFGLKYRDA